MIRIRNFQIAHIKLVLLHFRTNFDLKINSAVMHLTLLTINCQFARLVRPYRHFISF